MFYGGLMLQGATVNNLPVPDYGGILEAFLPLDGRLINGANNNVPYFYSNGAVTYGEQCTVFAPSTSTQGDIFSSNLIDTSYEYGFSFGGWFIQTGDSHGFAMEYNSTIISVNHNGGSYQNSSQNNKITAIFRTPGTYGDTLAVESTIATPFNTWTHIFVTYSYITNTAKLYINGYIDNTLVLEKQCIPLVGDIKTKLLPSSFNPYNIIGQMNNITTYNGLLSDTDVLEIYTVSQGIDVIPVGLVAHYPMELPNYREDIQSGNVLGQNGIITQLIHDGRDCVYLTTSQAGTRPSLLNYVNRLYESGDNFSVGFFYNQEVSFGTSEIYLMTVNGIIIETKNGTLHTRVNGTLTDTGVSYNLNTWYHIGFTYNDTTLQGILYLNGSPVHYDTYSVQITKNSKFHIGSEYLSVRPTLVYYDEVKLFNTLLSSTDMSILASE